MVATAQLRRRQRSWGLPQLDYRTQPETAIRVMPHEVHHQIALFGLILIYAMSTRGRDVDETSVAAKASQKTSRSRRSQS